jgi:hypothetical protein
MAHQLTLAAATVLVSVVAPQGPATTTVDWAAAPIVTYTTPSCQVVVEPPMFPGSSIRATQLHWLAELGVEASPVFWQSWFVYPHSGVAQLQPGEWDFSQITPLLQDMLNATHGRDLCFQFGTVPEFMLNGPMGDRRWDYGAEKWNETLVWGYRDGGTTFRNLTEVGEYFANFISYYTAGGFTDSRTGKHYDSGFHYDIPWFEYGNEMEYSQSPETFTLESDAVNAAVKRVAPSMKFLGLGELQGASPEMFSYFLNASNHVPGAPISEAIDYHFYAVPASRTDASTYASMFERGDEFIEYVKQIELIRKRLAPQTKSYLKELGVIAPGDNQLDPAPLPDVFWSAKAAYWAYLFSQLAMLKIDVASMSQLVGGNPLACMHPNGTSCSTNSGPPTPMPYEDTCTCSGSNYASVTMLDWRDGKPTAAYWVLKLLVEEFGNREKQMFPTKTTALGPRSSCVNPTPEATEAAIAECDGGTITSLDFFSYGTPSGSCSSTAGILAKGKCNSPNNLTEFVSKVCVGAAGCSVYCDCINPPSDCKVKSCHVAPGTGGTPQLFSPFLDPCVYVPKFIALNVTCTNVPPRLPVPADVFVQAFKVDGVRKLLVVNKEADPRAIKLGAEVSEGSQVRYIAADEPWSAIRNSTWGAIAGTVPGWFAGVVILERDPHV